MSVRFLLLRKDQIRVKAAWLHFSHFYNKSNLQNFQSCSKSKISTEKLSGVLYEIPCGDCQGVYVGQSSQYLHKRLDGHKFNQHEVTAQVQILVVTKDVPFLLSRRFFSCAEIYQRDECNAVVIHHSKSIILCATKIKGI